MEHISDSLQKASSEVSQSQSQTTPISNEISIYSGKLTKRGFAEQTPRILKAFPKMPIETFEILKERFKANGFDDERLKASIDSVIDTYEGWDKLPNIANFIQFDKKIKVHSYYDFLEITRDMDASTRTAWQGQRVYKKIKGREGLYYVLKTDYENYKHLFEG